MDNLEIDEETEKVILNIENPFLYYLGKLLIKLSKLPISSLL